MSVWDYRLLGGVLRRGLPGSGAALAQRVISGGIITSPVLTFSRAQLAGVEAVYLLADGTWALAAADVPRRHLGRGIIIEPQRTNFHPNPRYEPTTGAGMPTGGGVGGSLGTLTFSISAQTIRNGLPGRVVSVSGTAASAGSFNCVVFLNAIPAASQSPSTPYARSRFNAVLSGTTATFNNVFFSSDGGVAGLFVAVVNSSAVTRRVHINNSVATPTAINMYNRFAYAASSTHNIELWQGGDMAEEGTFATLPVFPPVGSPGPCTRGADNLTAAVSAIGTGGAFSLALGFECPALPPSGENFTVLSVNDGTANNQLRVRVTNAGNIIASHVIGGVETDIGTIGSAITAGSDRRRLAMSWDGSTFRVVRASGGDVSATGLSALAGLLSTVRYGAGPAGVNAGGLLMDDADTYPAPLLGSALVDAALALPA